MDREYWMAQALEQARQAAEAGEIPIGCVIVREGVIIGRGHNRCERSRTVTAHAELEAIRQAGEALDTWRLDECDLYVTVEPCPMCAGAVLNARIRAVYYGVREHVSGACGGVMNLFMEPFPYHPAVTGGILREECQAVLTDFFTRLRKRTEKSSKF